MDKLILYEAHLDERLSKLPYITELEKRTGIKKTYMAAGVAAIMTIMLIFNYAGSLLASLLGFVYPAYASFKAIESKTKVDDTHWLTYWVVFSTFHITETFAGIFIQWLPYYYLLKTLALIWLYHPATRGAEQVYRTYLAPQLRAKESVIDDTLNNLKSKVGIAATVFDSAISN
jgi:receptor expression-enhancing protein 5/6